MNPRKREFHDRIEAIRADCVSRLQSADLGAWAEKLLDTRIIWGRKMTRTGGLAYSSRNLVKLSWLLLSENPDQLDEIVRHEFAHIVCPPGTKHSNLWFVRARLLGSSGERCHRMRRPPVFRIPGGRVTCTRCKEVVTITRRQARRLRAGLSTMVHRVCGAAMRAHPDTPEERVVIEKLVKLVRLKRKLASMKRRGEA